MNVTTLIFESPSGVQQAQVQPNEPRTYTLLFEGEGRVNYGTDGGPPTTPLQPGKPTQVRVHVNSMHLEYEVARGKLQWSF